MLRFAILLGLALLLGITADLTAAPQIENASLRGLTSGKTTHLTLTGKQLAPNPVIHLDFPAGDVRVQPGSNGQTLELEIDLPAEMPPRLGQLRVATETGISNPIMLGIDSLPQAPFSETTDTLPIALSGSLSGAQLLTTSFSGKAGQRVVIEVEAQRLGSKLQPLVSLVDSRDTQLGYSSREIAMQGDARLVVELPSDGLYTIKLQDALFRGGTPGHFRLKVGDLAYADRVFPLAVHKTEDAASLKPLTTLKTESPLEARLTNWDANDATVANLSVEVMGATTGPQPIILRSDVPEFVEPNSPETATSLGAAPLGISGILQKPKERDEYLIDVTPGTKYRAEVFAQRVHSPVDAVLEVRKPDGAMLATSDDQTNTPDPAVTFEVPSELEQVKLVVYDLSHASGPTHAYRLLVSPENRPDFQLHVAQQRVNIPAGGSTVVEVVAERRGFNEAIVLRFPQLPPGVTTSLHEIPARADRALVTFTAASDAHEASVGPIFGETEINGLKIVREAAVGPNEPVFGLAPETSQLGFGIVQKPKLLVTWSSDLPEDALGLGQVTALPLTVKRAEGQTGPVRFSLLTSQVVPQDQGKPAPTKAIRLAKEVILPADQADATLTVITPPQLDDVAWDIAAKAELLSADQKKVVATAISPAKRFTLGSPLFLTLSGETVVRFQGKVERAGGFQHPVIVTVNGLPPEAKSAAVEVPADKSDFAIEIILPPGMKQEQLAGVHLIATAKRNGADVTSNPIPIKLETGQK